MIIKVCRTPACALPSPYFSEVGGSEEKASDLSWFILFIIFEFLSKLRIPRSGVTYSTSQAPARRPCFVAVFFFLSFFLFVPLLSDPFLLLGGEDYAALWSRKDECSRHGEVRDQELGFESRW